MNGRHGMDCPKEPHHGGGYLHGADDDQPYDVDGVMYCGRCHGWMGIAVSLPPTPKGECYCGPAECFMLKDGCKRMVKDADGNIVAFIPPPGLQICPDCNKTFKGPDDRCCPHCHCQAKSLKSPFDSGAPL